MPHNNYQYNELKRKLRELKRLEGKLRPNAAQLIWNDYFDISDEPNKNAKYALADLYHMSKDIYKNIIGDYLYHVYDCVWKESGLSVDHFINAEVLKQLGLPFFAEQDEIKKQFHELVKMYHPDNGGDSTKFIEIMEQYKNSGMK